MHLWTSLVFSHEILSADYRFQKDEYPVSKVMFLNWQKDSVNVLKFKLLQYFSFSVANMVNNLCHLPVTLATVYHYLMVHEHNIICVSLVKCDICFFKLSPHPFSDKESHLYRLSKRVNKNPTTYASKYQYQFSETNCSYFVHFYHQINIKKANKFAFALIIIHVSRKE